MCEIVCVLCATFVYFVLKCIFTTKGTKVAQRSQEDFHSHQFLPCMENHMIKQIFLTLISFALFLSCSRTEQEQKEGGTASGSFEIQYAQGFKVSDHGSYKTGEVTY